VESVKDVVENIGGQHKGTMPYDVSIMAVIYHGEALQALIYRV
jgi:hypothetical protein